MRTSLESIHKLTSFMIEDFATRIAAFQFDSVATITAILALGFAPEGLAGIYKAKIQLLHESLNTSAIRPSYIVM